MPHQPPTSDESPQPAPPIPEGAAPGRTTPIFSLATTPAALLKDHHTTVWAQVIVSAGSVAFSEPNTGRHETATEDNPVTIVPNQPHRITPSTDAQFRVQFYKDPE